MSWVPITDQELKELGRRITSEFVAANSQSELLGKLNDDYFTGWTLLRAPAWVGDKLVALVVRPRTEDE